MVGKRPIALPRVWGAHIIRLSRLITLIAVWLGMPGAYSAAAQAGIAANTSFQITYGESITFSVSANSPQALTSAQLVVETGDPQNSIIVDVPIQSGTSISTTYRLLLGDQHVPPFFRGSYHWVFQDDLGQIHQTTEETLLYQDNAVPWEWQALTTEQTTVHTNGENQLISEVVMQAALRTQTQLAVNLDARVDGPIDIYVYPELAPMAASLRLHGVRVQDWVAAYAIPQQNVVFISSYYGEGMVDALERDVAHEVTHLVIYAAVSHTTSPNIPGWLNEGLALASSPDTDANLQSVLNTALNNGVLLSLEGLCVSTFENLPPHDAALAYAQSESVVRHLIDRFGYAEIRTLLAAYAGGATCSEGVQTALGLSLAQLEGQWHNLLSGSERPRLQNEVTIFPWLIVWLSSLGLATLFIQPQRFRTDERSAYDTRIALPMVSEQFPVRTTKKAKRREGT